MAAPQRPVRVLPQTRRRGPAITIFRTYFLHLRYILFLQPKTHLLCADVSDLTFIFNESLINTKSAPAVQMYFPKHCHWCL